MQLLERALADNDENIQLAARDNDVLVKSGRDDDLFAAGRGAIPQVARRLPAAGEQPPRRADRRAVLRGRPPGGHRHQRGAPRRRFHLRRGEGRAGRPRRPNTGESHVELPIAYDGAEMIITLDPRYLSDFLRVLGPRADDHAGAARRGERGGMFYRGRLRLRDHALGARPTRLRMKDEKEG